MAIHKIKIFTGRDSEYLAKKIAASFGTTLGQSEVLRFSDGEFQPCYNESIRGCTVFIIQSTFPPSDNLMELLMMIDAARRASAHQVVAVKVVAEAFSSNALASTPEMVPKYLALLERNPAFTEIRPSKVFMLLPLVLLVYLYVGFEKSLSLDDEWKL